MKKRFSDQEIVAAIQGGNADRELQFLYDTTQKKIRAYILRNNGSISEAQDIFQDAVVALFQKVLKREFDLQKSIDGFLFSVARNAWITRAKRINRTVNNGIAMASQKMANQDHYLNQTIDKEHREKVLQLLDRIGERCKELLTYSVFYRMPMEEIAHRMGFSGANAAKSQNYKCKQKLIRLVNDHQHLKTTLFK
ncbi:MAG: RNA polymerase sigma factor [Salibacteraceae bacterium]